MSIKDVLIIILIICIVGVVLFGSFGNFFGLISGITGDISTISNSYHYSGENISNYIYQRSQNVNSNVVYTNENFTRSYDDWQEDQQTNMVDDDGNPIYLSIISTSGGQMDPGIYQVYWSGNGPINQTRIG